MQACPVCSAIYSKVEAALTRPEPSFPPSRSVQQSRQKPAGEFIETLRAETHYPTFRGVVRVGTWLFYAAAVIAILITIFAGASDGNGRFYTIIALVLAIIFVTAAKEASLMLADLSDAAVHSAQRSGQHG